MEYKDMKHFTGLGLYDSLYPWDSKKDTDDSEVMKVIERPLKRLRLIQILQKLDSKKVLLVSLGNIQRRQNKKLESLVQGKEVMYGIKVKNIRQLLVKIIGIGKVVSQKLINPRVIYSWRHWNINNGARQFLREITTLVFGVVQRKTLMQTISNHTQSFRNCVYQLKMGGHFVFLAI